MNMFQSFHLHIFLSLIASVSVAVSQYSKPGCTDTCGNVRIPYPFGIGASCSVNRWYTIDCNSSKPYLSALGLEVLGVNLEDQIVTVNTPQISGCQIPARNSSQIVSLDLSKSPFLFSRSHNKFVVEGSCGNAVMMEDGSVLTGCSTNCLNGAVSDKNNCVGVTCCETTIPHHIKSYAINLTGLERQDGGCGSAFFMDRSSSYAARDNSSIPVSLLWTLADYDRNQTTCCSSKDIVKVDTGNNTTVDSWKCSNDYRPFEGTSYLIDGCDDTEECARCKNDTGRYCSYTRIYDADGLAREWNFTCGYFPMYNYHSYMVTIIAIYCGNNSYSPCL